MIYVGVTAYMAERMTQHREDLGSAYCRKFGIKMLVYAEWYDVIHDAIDREERLKVWKRSGK